MSIWKLEAAFSFIPPIWGMESLTGPEACYFVYTGWLAGFQDPLVSPFLALGMQMSASMSSFYVGVGNTSMPPHACAAGTLPIETSLSYLSFAFFRM